VGSVNVAVRLTHQLTHIDADIFRVDNLLDVSLCKHLIDIAECSQFEAARVELERLDRAARNNDLLYLDDDRSSLLQSTNQLLLQRVGIVQELLYKHYSIKFPHAEACRILRYKPGQQYKRHVDNILLSSRMEEAARGVPIRDVSIVGYLNDDFEGGELLFDRQSIKVTALQGSVVVFPANYVYPHQALPVRRGCKYSFTTWLYH
jgi:predicted 2-oxoglutarate/Fe(II)-dependent dioxygenase YbiX